MARKWNPNIANESRKAGKQFKKWQSGNPNGRPKKWIALVNEQLAKEWYNPASKADIETNYMAMVQLEEKKLKEIVNDPAQPMLIRILSKNMLSGKGFDIIEKMLDRGIGKPKQTTDMEIKSTNLNIEWPLKEKTDQELTNLLLGALK